MSNAAIAVIGTNVVFDYGSKEAAMAAFEALDAPEGAADFAGLRVAAWRLCEAIADKAAIDGLIASGHSRDWRNQMDAETEFMAALKELRTACDGRPR